MLYEIRTYTFKPLRGADWLALYKVEGLPLQQEFLGELIGFFTTEIGDISQIVTANLAAHYHSPVSVGVGALLGLWTVAALAILTGQSLMRFVDVGVVRK